MNELEIFFVFYFFCINLFYLFLLISAFFGIIKVQKQIESAYVNDIFRIENLPSIGFIVPAYNESASILYTIQTLLNLSYRKKKIFIVNDGSTDSTLEILNEAFKLSLVHAYCESDLKTELVTGFYQSLDFDNLFVIDKMRGGRSDAINSGINNCITDYIITVDADTLISKNELNQMIRYFLSHPEVRAAGASLRVINGCSVHLRGITKIQAPNNLIAGIQAVEYLRAFILGRFGMEPLGGSLVISGAFSFYDRQIVKEVGGFCRNTVGEDMDITVSIKHYLGNRKRNISTLFIPEPVAWTEVPEDLATLSRQRTRWSTGLAEVLWKYKSMMFNIKYGLTGLIIFPYYVFGELLQPLVEVIAYAFICYQLAMGTGNYLSIALLTTVSIGFSIVLNMMCILIEQLSFRKYNSIRDLFKLFFYGLIENIGYRQLNVYWRLKGLCKMLIRSKGWEVVGKTGFKKLKPSS